MSLLFVGSMIMVLNTTLTFVLLSSGASSSEQNNNPPAAQPAAQPDADPAQQPEGNDAGEREQRLDKAVKSIVSHISIIRNRIKVGTQTVGYKIKGAQIEEVPWPAKDLVIRQSRGPGDLHRRLPSERGLPPTIQMTRLLSGESLISAYQEEREIKEPVIEPVYLHQKSTVYLLLDRSGSMEAAWKQDLWKSVAHGLLDQAVEADALFLMREFDTDFLELQSASGHQEAAAIHSRIDSIVPDGGTSIKKAIAQAINDVKDQDLPDAEIMILTDGQDDKLSSSELRSSLEAAGIKLHAILIGTQNKALREAAHLYQEIDHTYKINLPIRN